MSTPMVPALRESLRGAMVLAITAIAAAALLGITQRATRDRIALATQQDLLRQLHDVVAPARYDNDLVKDTIVIEDPALGPVPARAWRARKAGVPVAAIVSAVAPGGYGGDIGLLIGIDTSGRLTGVRVLSHRETPGLGDRIDSARGDWLLGFDGRSLADPPAARWAVRRDGGEFDQISGATVTSRATLSAVRRALEYFQANAVAVFAMPAPPP